MHDRALDSSSRVSRGVVAAVGAVALAAIALGFALGVWPTEPTRDGTVPEAPALSRSAAQPGGGHGLGSPAVGAAGASRPGSAPEQARAAAGDASPGPTDAGAAEKDDDATWIDPDGEPSEALIRGAFEAAWSEIDPERELSGQELTRLTDAALALRHAQSELRRLPLEPAWAERRRALRDQIAQAGAVFDEVVAMSPSEFTEAAQPDTGVDAFSDEEAIPEPEFLDDLR